MSALKKLGVSKDDPAALFEVLGEVGEGAYARVYKCRRLEDDLIVAIKLVPLDADLDSVKAEIEILKDCESEHVVSYQGCYERDDDLWIVMEYMGAGSVADMVDDLEDLTEQEIACVCRGILHGLQYLHSVKKLHRDIKAGNVLLTDGGVPKLADFGVSAKLKDTFSKRNTSIGTPFWMAPEVILESDYDGRADIWSLGITCIEMAEGEPPYFELHPMRAVFMIPSRPPPTLKEADKWSSDFHDFVAQCLRKEPEDRPTAAQLLEHPFIAKAANDTTTLANLVARYKKYLEENPESEGSGDESESSSSEEEEGMVKIRKPALEVKKLKRHTAKRATKKKSKGVKWADESGGDADADSSRRISVYDKAHAPENLLGEVVVSANTTIEQMMELVASELGCERGFSLKKKNVPISAAQAGRKAFEFFRMADDYAVVC